MPYFAGFAVALMVSVTAAFIGLDKDRAFYPMVLAVVASYYSLFAVMGGSVQAVLIESSIMFVFLIATILGFKRNLWFVVLALVAHGLFDFVHGYVVANAGAPPWWPMFCLTYDVSAAACLAVLLRYQLRRARP